MSSQNYPRCSINKVWSVVITVCCTTHTLKDCQSPGDKASVPLVISVDLHVLISLYDFQVFYVLQLPIAVGPHRYRHIKILYRDQGNRSTKETPSTTVLWSVLTPVVGVDSYVLPLKSQFHFIYQQYKVHNDLHNTKLYKVIQQSICDFRMVRLI